MALRKLLIGTGVAPPTGQKWIDCDHQIGNSSKLFTGFNVGFIHGLARHWHLRTVVASTPLEGRSNLKSIS